MAVLFRSEAHASGTGTAISVSVPSGAAQYDIAWVDLYLTDNTTDSDATITAAAPSGFNFVAAIGTQGQGTRGRHFIFWKRLTGADAGTYDFSQTVSVGWEIVARLYSGVTRIKNPWNVPIQSAGSVGSSALTVAVPSVTPGGSDGCIVGAGSSHTTSTSNAWTPPTGYTERYDGQTHLEAFDREGAPASATGSITITSSQTTGSSYPKGYQIPLAGAGHVRTRSFVGSAATSISLPEHEAGDRITIAVFGKYDTATIPTISAGWTLIGSATGGTGATGTADVGPMFAAIYQKDAASSSETNPTLTPGGTAPDSWTAIIVVAAPAADHTWRDAITTSSPTVQFVSDTDTATPLTGTTPAFTGAVPTADDELLLFGGVPTDSGFASPTVSMSVTGLSDGTQATSLLRTATTLGTDMAMAFADWVNMSGTASSGATASLAMSSTNNSGLIAVVALRQETGTPSVSASWTGSAAFTASVVAVGIVTAAWTGSGAFTASAVEVEQTAAAWNGSGSFSATAFEVYERTVAWNGSGSFSATVEAENDVNADWTGSGAFSATVVPVSVVDAPWDGAGSFSASIVQVGDVAAAWAGSGAWTADVETVGEGEVLGAWDGSGAFTATASINGVLGETDNIDNGIDLDGTALVEWEPAVVATPARYANILAMDTARAVELTAIGEAGQPLITVQNAQAQRARDRILIGGADFTYFRGVNTPTPDFRLIKPLLWGSGTLVLPQVNPQYELLGPGASGALKRIKDGAIVVVQRVLDNVVIATDYVGFVDAIDTSGRVLSLTLGGHASGRAARDYVPPPVFRKRHDAEFQILNYLRTLNLRTTRGGEVGIPLTDRGGQDGLSLVNELVSLAVKADGTTYDVMPTTGRVFDMVETDRTTIDATVYFDDVLATQQLARAFSEEPNVVYATGRTKRGEIVNNAKAPGLVQGDAPAFPGDKELGNTGAAVVLIQQQLTIGGFLNYADLDDEGTFDQDTADAVAELQEEAGLATVAAAGGWLGKVNSITWDTLWDLDVIGYSIDRARIFPMAQRDYTRKWNFAANGGKRSRNRDWDPHRIKSAVSISDGLTGFNRRRIKRFARSKLAPSGVSNWQGTLALTSGVIAGEHTPGDPITAADVMPARALRPGMNLWAPLFDGGTLFHISGVDVSSGGGSVSLILDTQARDTMAAWEAISRNRETRSNPARAWSGHTRASSVEHDTMADWTDICGNLAHQIPLVAEGWTEVMVPAGQEGVVQKIRMQLDPADEFAVILSQRRIGLNMLNARIPTPLTLPESGRPWYEQEAITDWLDGRGVLDSWGTPKQPCGYDPSLKNDENGPTAQPITGLLKETAGLNYEAAQPGRLFLYVWTWTGTYLQPGRILEQQLTSAV